MNTDMNASPNERGELDMGPDWFVLIGVVVIVVGFLLKLDAIAVVIIAAMATAFIAGSRSAISSN